MLVVCPKCQQELYIPSEWQGDASCPTCHAALEIEPLKKAECPICCTGFSDDDTVVLCPNCGMPHHKDCWTENGGCSTYGCGSAKHEEIHSSAAEDSDAMEKCPYCGAPHPKTDLVCSSCGKILNETATSGFSPGKVRETTKQIVDQAKASLFPKIARNFKLLGNDIAFVFRLWWGEFSQYATFSGQTNRRAYWAFIGVNYALYRLLDLCGAKVVIILEIIVLILPLLAATVRRLRDTDVSPWLIFAFPLLPLLLLVPSVPRDVDAQHPA